MGQRTLKITTISTHHANPEDRRRCCFPIRTRSKAGVALSNQFPEDLFPLTGAALSGLGTVVLDHVPRWEPAKRQAFLDWLRVAPGRCIC